MIEKWANEYKVSASERGEHADKTIAELKKLLKNAKTREERGEYVFVIRAKQQGAGKWGKIK